MTIKQTLIQRIELDKKSIFDKRDVVASDETICLFINEEFYRTFIATAGKIRELVIGHLITEAIIQSFCDVKEIEIQRSKAYITLNKKPDLTQITMEKTELITTACGFLGLPPKRNQLKSLWNDSNLFVDPEMIWCAAQELHKRSKVYKETGGTHSAILCSANCEVYAYAPDVGRHNAVDKVVGEGISKNIDLRSCVIVSSGRLSGEIVLKAARSGIPIIASVSGPLESGIRIAEETGITLIGFIRGRRMNLYTHNKRISFE